MDLGTLPNHVNSCLDSFLISLFDYILFTIIVHGNNKAFRTIDDLTISTNNSLKSCSQDTPIKKKLKLKSETTTKSGN